MQGVPFFSLSYSSAEQFHSRIPDFERMTQVASKEQIVATICYACSPATTPRKIAGPSKRGQDRQSQAVFGRAQDAKAAEIDAYLAVLPVVSSLLAPFTELLLGFWQAAVSLNKNETLITC
jgi:hypothetical protein